MGEIGPIGPCTGPLTDALTLEIPAGAGGRQLTVVGIVVTFVARRVLVPPTAGAATGGPWLGLRSSSSDSSGPAAHVV